MRTNLKLSESLQQRLKDAIEDLSKQLQEQMQTGTDLDIANNVAVLFVPSPNGDSGFCSLVPKNELRDYIKDCDGILRKEGLDQVIGDAPLVEERVINRCFEEL